MRIPLLMMTLVVASFAISAQAFAVEGRGAVGQEVSAVSLGSRPAFLVDAMGQSELKDKLSSCRSGPFASSKFSIGHRGAPLQFPEHTRESYIAAANMGAGILECDVTFTKDRVLVCRHSQCDLHQTTNILETDLASRCSIPPDYDRNGKLLNRHSVQCCTSDITAAEFKSLRGKMDEANSNAFKVAEDMRNTGDWGENLQSKRGTLMTHAESIRLFDELGVDFAPELKLPHVDMPFEGEYTQQQYAAQLIEEYKAAGIPAARVWPQSFQYDDVLYWIENFPAFGKQGVYLDGDYDIDVSLAEMRSWRAAGVQVLAPPIWMLLDVDTEGQIIPSGYANNAKQAGFGLITWTLERSGPLSENGGWYYQSVNGERGGKDVIENDGDMLEVLHVLANDVGVQGVFSDWPATTTFYANCMGLK